MGYYPRVTVVHNLDDIYHVMEMLGVAHQAQKETSHRSLTTTLKIGNLSPQQAKALATTAQATGISAYIKTNQPPTKTQVLLIGNLTNLYNLASQLANSSPLGDQLKEAVDNDQRQDFRLHCGPYSLPLSQRTHIMGVLNITPDSFSDGGVYLKPDKAIAHAKELVAQGADIIDIGGESSRPGAESISPEEELARILPVLRGLLPEIEVPISIDTYKAQVAEAALKLGAHMINDISGLHFDPNMAKTIAQYDVPVVIMHFKGTPKDMQQNPLYESLMGEIIDYLLEGIELAGAAGISPHQIVIDPGIGFGKTVQHNLQILNRLSELKTLGKPIMLGTSRKSFIGKVLDLPVDQREEGTAASISCAILHGAHIVRVHDVAKMAQVAKLTDAIQQAPAYRNL